MAENETSSLRRFAGRIGATFLALLLLYPLSAGPGWMIVILKGHGRVTWQQLYDPVFWAADATGTEDYFGIYIWKWELLAQHFLPPKA